MQTPHRGSTKGFRAPDAPGHAFRDGKLYSWRYDRIVVLRGGDRPAAWAKTRDRQGWFSSARLAAPAFKAALWHPAESHAEAVGLVRGCPVLGDGQLVFPEFRSRFANDLALAAFHDTIPQAIRERLQRLVYVDRQWEVYNLLARCPGAADLFDNNPALAYALANARAFNQVRRPLESVRRLVRRRQREALGYLNFPVSEMARKILTKTCAEWVDVEDLLRLRRILLHDAEAGKWLAHLPSINDETITVLACHRDAVSMPLLQEMVADEAVFGEGQFWLEMANPLRQRLGLRWPAFRSLNALRSHYHELVRQVAVASTFQELPEQFPPPPVLPSPGWTGIRPITSLRELYRHGAREHNCALSYAPSIAHGQLCIYAVDRPVRATLSFVRGDSGWVPCDFLGPANTRLPEWTREFVLSAFDGLFTGRHDADTEMSPVCPEDSRTPFD